VQRGTRIDARESLIGIDAAVRDVDHVIAAEERFQLAVVRQ